MSKYEWDEAKNQSNIQKHGISFDEASYIFDGPVLTNTDTRATDELREISFGLLGSAVVLAVIHTDRHGVTRIISARKATKQERKLYNAYFARALS